MSQKSKNLTYEANEPAFLRRLKGQYGGDNDRHDRPIARPRKQKEGDDDDEPTYVDEESNDTISKEQYEKMLALQLPNNDETTLAGDNLKDNEASTDHSSTPAAKKAVEASIGTKKRRLAKTIDTTEVEQHEGSDGQKKSAKKTKKAQKAQKVKLSFDDGE